MARNVDFDPAFFAWLERSPGVDDLTREGAEKVLAEQIRTAPEDTKEYVESLHVEKSPQPGRVTYRVGSNLEKSMAIEARTGHLARSVKGAGRA